MRKQFVHEQQAFGTTPISEVKIATNCRDALSKLLIGLLHIYKTPKLNTAINGILSKAICKPKKATGRPGMGLWELFVLSQIKLGTYCSYDKLQNLANNHKEMRSVMGVDSSAFVSGKQYDFQNIYDNIGLLAAPILSQINEVLVEAGHQVFKKRGDVSLHIKTDSFVVESNVHFPTDYKLLWDSARKCLDYMLSVIKKDPQTPGWRKLNNWYVGMKGLMRGLSKATSGGGKHKEQRVKQAARAYITKAGALLEKLSETLQELSRQASPEVTGLARLRYFMQMLHKHIDLLERRLLKGEVIPHDEKLFSIFETYTEWIKKGKTRPAVELGKKLLVSTDQYHLIVDYQVMEHQSDSGAVIGVADRILNKYAIESISFDKGFWSPENKELLSLFIPTVILSKKGKLNQKEKEAAQSPMVKKLRKAHSAVESNINELEHRGLGRCPNRGYANFKSYIGLGICAYNLHKIGSELLKREKAKQKKAKDPGVKLAA